MNDRYDDMYEAASRYYIQGETMESIAHQLGLSRSTISRLLKQARTSGLVRISLAHHNGSRSPLAAALTRAFGVRVHLVGVRDVVDADGLERVFSVLRAPHTEEPTNWSRRYKANLEKLASGDVIKVAEVVRDLWRRDKERGLSAGEKRMLSKARQILVSELALAEKTDEVEAESILDGVLAS